MYSYIKGTIKSSSENHLVIENGGIGYSINTSMNTVRNSKLNEEATVHTYLYVREDIISIYGFASIQELELFKNLIKISGVGPKAGLSILSLSDVNTLKYSIFNGDYKFISKASGIGKKTAEKIIIELKDKVKDEFSGSEINVGIEYPAQDSEFLMEALTSLGFNSNEAKKALNAIDRTGLTDDQVLKIALKKMGS
ncbi:Holliday junction DNA helicase subunit RuvA [Dethiosulfatibacter aminovorans DSM 17477]|uniref:Holliday junction branch migration complex subunit RuvA n=1 Tax=Dethiosulfatibacter aminovorans DSM 17477 TaxID=1121476 RepID=A0A1M6D2Q4_9FIRM|nr:Holliday junction branch migration protein RuvA [Dethiosulfatibacter aminovorans]SHI67532.1 Holliday junction DNA helicase subunit RuvA [Dethiosulfatibacter aminovorans DSM 17477]